MDTAWTLRDNLLLSLMVVVPIKTGDPAVRNSARAVSSLIIPLTALIYYPGAGYAVVLYRATGTQATYCCNTIKASGNNAV